MTPQDTQETQTRWQLLEEVHAFLDKPMVALAFVWLLLMILDFARGLTQGQLWLMYGIWALFGLHFALEFTIAPSKRAYLRTKWLTAVALVLPAARAFRALQALRVLRLAKAARGLAFLRLIASMNRGMRALGTALAERGIGYVLALTLLVLFSGAAGMRVFESPAALVQAGVADPARPDLGLSSYPEALWWTAMVLTTMGSEYWPRTAEGRLLTWLLALFAFAIFGYIAGTIASYFVGPERSAQLAPQQAALQEATASMQAELAALRGEMARLLGGARGPEAA